MSQPGALVVVATPIGNLGDLSSRAVEALRAADVIVCEDTRRTGRLLSHLGIEAPRMLVANEHTEASIAGAVVPRVRNGDRVVLVTDAGTPGISDPGERVVRAVLDAGYAVEQVPGPSALVAALVVSGLATGRFAFEGFLPRKGSARSTRLAAVARIESTVVLYEAPHRLARTLDDLIEACGERRGCVLARELTKLHEEVWRGTLGEAVEHVAAVAPRGEYVVLLEGAPEMPEPTDDEIRAALEAARAAGASTKDAVDEVASVLGASRRRVYGLAHEESPGRP